MSCRQALYPLSYGALCMRRLLEKRTILMKSRNSIWDRSLHSEFSPVIYVTDNRSKSLKKTARPLLSMTPHIYIRPETDYDLPSSCEPANIQIKYGACYLTTPNRLGIAGMTLEPNKERQNSWKIVFDLLI